KLGIWTKTLQTESKDRGKHNGMEEAEKHKRPHRSAPRGGQSDGEAGQCAASKHAQQSGGGNLLHHRRTRQSPQHEAEYMKLQIARRHFFVGARNRKFGKAK